MSNLLSKQQAAGLVGLHPEHLISGPRYQRCPRECHPVGASVILERDRGHVRTRLMLCQSCRQRWWQHRC